MSEAIHFDNETMNSIMKSYISDTNKEFADKKVHSFEFKFVNEEDFEDFGPRCDCIIFFDYVYENGYRARAYEDEFNYVSFFNEVNEKIRKGE